MGRKTVMNSITSPELLAQVNPKNKEILKDFLDYLRSVQRSETTIHGYENDIEIAWVWCLQNNENRFYCDWTKRQIVKYQNWLIYDNKNSPARVRRLRAALSSLGNYIESVLDDEYPNYRNIINKIEAPVNQPVREKTVLSDDDVETLLRVLTENKKYEKACFVALAAFGGRRKAELCRFKLDDFSDNNLVCGGSLYKSSPIKTKGRGGGKIIPCYTLAKKFKPYLDNWVGDREQKGIKSEWLFPKNENMEEHIQISTANSWMESVSKILNKEVYCHSFRHYFTTALSNEGLPDNVIKEIQGWGNISMVAVYLDRSTEDTLEMYFDENGIIKKDRKDLTDL